MLFNSYIFVLFFLPICITGYFIFNHFNRFKVAQIFLLAMSLWFYAYFNVNYLPIIICSIVVNYFLTNLLCCVERLFLKRTLLLVLLVFNVGVLFYFKYYDFFFETINAIFHTNFVLLNVVLPLGISFFTFQQISYIIDSYKGQVPAYNLIQYASFVTFFPQLIAGPIVTHDELIPQFEDISRKSIDWDNLSQGIYLFVLGLAKKVLLADVFGNVANIGFANIAELNSMNAALTMISYTFQIYFDFSGYCDMAIGIGKMLNIDLPVNFNSPYKALTITEFWERWHRTLTRFFTKYIYIPLGGNRKGTVHTCVNIMIVFLLSGLWHGANWTFILWGVCHGIFFVTTKLFKLVFDKIHPVFNWMLTFAFINVTWILFRANSIQDALRLLNRIISFDYRGGVRADFINCFNFLEYGFLLTSKIGQILIVAIMFFFFFFSFFTILVFPNAYEKMLCFKPTLFKMLFMSCLLVWCILSFSGISTFLYFNF